MDSSNRLQALRSVLARPWAVFTVLVGCPDGSAPQAPPEPAGRRRPDLSAARVRRRYAAERRFRFYGAAAIARAEHCPGA